MQKILFFLAIFIPFAGINAQKVSPLCLLSSSQQIHGEAGGGLPIKNLRRLYKTNSILVKTPDNKKMVFENRLVWGYEINKNVVYRNCSNYFLKIEALTDSIIIYSRIGKGYKGRPVTTYFFSKGLNAPVYVLNKEAIHKQYQENACLQKKADEEFKWPYKYAYWENKNSTFKIIRVLNECN
jgi:hypothetical protein